MKTFLFPFLAWSCLTVVVLAQELPATIRVLPEDVVQTSIRQFRSPGDTNKVTVKWQYTEAGARKMLAFWRGHAGEKVVQKIGDFECHPTISTNKPPNWSEDGWLKSRTDKFFAVTEEEATKIIAGFKATR